MVLTLADADGGLARPPLPEHPFPRGPSEAQPLAILPGELPFALWKAFNKAQPAPLPHLRLILPNHPCSRASQCGESWTAVETRALAPGLAWPLHPSCRFSGGEAHSHSPRNGSGSAPRESDPWQLLSHSSQISSLFPEQDYPQSPVISHTAILKPAPPYLRSDKLGLRVCGR